LDAQTTLQALLYRELSPETVEKQAAPANYPGRYMSVGVYGLGMPKEPKELANTGSFPGAACFRTLRLHSRCQEIYEGVRLKRQSGLPDVASRSLNDEAKSGSPPDAGSSCALFFFGKP